MPFLAPRSPPFGLPPAQSVPSLPSQLDTGGLGDPNTPVHTAATRGTFQPENLDGLDSDGNLASIPLPKLQTTQPFINPLHVAVLEGSGMLDDGITNLCNPQA